jgi:hypothetical protein
MATGGERCHATATDIPKAEQDQKEPVAVLKVALLAAVTRKSSGALHQFDAEIESFPIWHQSIEPLLRFGTCGKPSLD